MSAIAAIDVAPRNTFLRRFLRSRAALVGLALFLAVVAMAALASWLYPQSPWRLVARPLTWPGVNPRFPLGTDSLGRNIAAGIFHGAQVSLLIAGISTAVAVTFGSLLGAVAGYFGGWLDDLLMRLTEVFQTIPPFLLAIVIVAIFGATLGTIIGAIAVTSWPSTARIVRAEAMRLRHAEFVQSCLVVGMSTTRIVLTQILPNCVAPIIVSASLLVANAILVESGLAFLGLGDPNVMSWGTIIGAGRSELRGAWYVCLIPGAVVMVTVLALNLIGDGLNDAFNPRLQRR
jgi:peptide/nickel transport system permease protein